MLYVTKNIKIFFLFSANVRAQYSEIYTVQYNAPSNIPSSCKDQYRGKIAGQITASQTSLQSLCTNVVDQNMIVGLTVDETSININSNVVNISPWLVSIHFESLSFSLSSCPTNISVPCFQVLLTIMAS